MLIRTFHLHELTSKKSIGDENVKLFVIQLSVELLIWPELETKKLSSSLSFINVTTNCVDKKFFDPVRGFIIELN